MLRLERWRGASAARQYVWRTAEGHRVRMNFNLEIESGRFDSPIESMLDLEFQM